jgi:hypothetical protein
MLAIAGIKTFPGIDTIENKFIAEQAAETRYREDTNSLAILLGQHLKLSPLRIEAAIRASLGTGGSYATDVIGAALIPDIKRTELDIIDKDLKYLFFESPTKSAITQNQRTLRSETAQKLYAESNAVARDIVNIKKDAKALLASN